MFERYNIDELFIRKYIIDYLEPLSNYYTQDGKKKTTLSRRKAIKEGSKHFSAVNNNYIKSIIN